MSDTESFYTKVVGVTHKNADGTSRQKIIRGCTVGERLGIVHDGKNKYSRHALAVLRADGRQCGYLGDDLADRLLEQMRRGVPVDAVVSKVTGGGQGESFGLNIRVIVDGDSSALDELADAVTFRQAAPNKSGCLGVVGRLIKIAVVVFVLVVLISIYAAFKR